MSKSVGPIGANGQGEFWNEWQKIEGKVRADCEKRAQCVQDAEEIFSQTRLAACKNFAKFSGRSTFYTWAVAIARHKAAHLLKARIERRKREQPLGEIVDSLVERQRIPSPIRRRRRRPADYACTAGGGRRPSHRFRGKRSWGQARSTERRLG